MKPPPLERHLQKTVVAYLRRRAQADATFLFRKNWGGPFATAGDPDFHGVWRSRAFAFELKPPGKTLTPLQVIRLHQWQVAGAWTEVVHSLDELENFLDRLGEKTIQNL